jgi:hypothetical protein
MAWVALMLAMYVLWEEEQTRVQLSDIRKRLSDLERRK